MEIRKQRRKAMLEGPWFESNVKCRQEPCYNPFRIFLMCAELPFCPYRMTKRSNSYYYKPLNIVYLEAEVIRNALWCVLCFEYNHWLFGLVMVLVQDIMVLKRMLCSPWGLFLVDTMCSAMSCTICWISHDMNRQHGLLILNIVMTQMLFSVILISDNHCFPLRLYQIQLN